MTFFSTNKVQHIRGKIIFQNVITKYIVFKHLVLIYNIILQPSLYSMRFINKVLQRKEIYLKDITVTRT